jgi:hypothetical protein
MEFTSVELAGGTKLAASVEKATIGLIEKATAGLCTGEARDGWQARWRGRRVVMLQHGDVGQRRYGEGGTVEKEAPSRRRRCDEVSFFFFF